MNGTLLCTGTRRRCRQESSRGADMRTILLIVAAGTLCLGTAFSQRGDIVIPINAEISVPAGAQICADRIYANNPGYGTLTLANPSCLCAGAVIVPVELLVFSARFEDGAVRLSWVTAAENGCAGFEVQRSGGDESWAPVGFVPGRGNSTIENGYAFEDPLLPAPKSDTLLYRLRVMDHDGTFRYSAVVEVRIGREIAAALLSALYPNPAQDCLTIRFSLPREAAVDLTLYSTTGGRTFRLRTNELFTRGHHVIQLPSIGFPPGAYLVELSAGGNRSVQPVVITR